MHFRKRDSRVLLKFETLYNTDNTAELDRAEYYRPQLERKAVNGKSQFFVGEKHGWYDDAAKMPKDAGITLCKCFDNYEEAEEMYLRQIQHRAAEGFCHAFSTDPMNPTGLVRYHHIVRS